MSLIPRGAMIVVVTTIVLVFSLRSVTYALRWNERLSFYQTTLREQPESIRLQLLLISEHLSRGEFPAAEATAQRATEQLPEYWEGWVARANVAMQQGKLDDADRYLRIAVETEGNPTARIARWMARVDELRRAATQPASGPAP
jgi:Tfp pilus assembly protein PilF